MHIHLPKPLHGWRALIGEVGIIVVGVLIALGAEQLLKPLTHAKGRRMPMTRSAMSLGSISVGCNRG